MNKIAVKSNLDTAQLILSSESVSSSKEKDLIFECLESFEVGFVFSPSIHDFW